MMEFESITLRNFFSVGDEPLTIQLNGKSPTLISGHNGSGKSVCVVDGICFALFGKPYKKVNKTDIVNVINEKNCLVELKIKVSGTPYRIIRGIKPNKFEIYENGELMDQDASVKDQQKYLEENILRVNFESFKQVVILSSSNFVPFMALTAAQRRVVIEDILDIEIFSQMSKIAKDRLATSTRKYNESDVDIMHKVSEIGRQQDLIKGYTEDQEEVTEGLQEQLEEYEAKFKKADKKYRKKKKAFDEVEEQYNYKVGQARTKVSAAEAKISNCERTIKSLKRELKEAEEWTECDTCGQEIPEDSRSTVLEKIKAKIVAKEMELDELVPALAKAKKRADSIAKFEPEIRKERDNISSLRSSVSGAESAMRLIQNQIKATEERAKKKDRVAKEEAILAEKQAEYDVLTEEFKRLGEDKKYDETMATLLKDNGIKAMVIDQYVPIINERVNYYLEVLKFFVDFRLDKTFDERIRIRHTDERSYSGLSQGEKQRIDLALLFTWRDVARLKNSINTNLLILDETFDSSLDVDGVDNLMSILAEFRDTNIFVISHKGDMLADQIDHHLVFEKQNNFTTVSEK